MLAAFDSTGELSTGERGFAVELESESLYLPCKTCNPARLLHQIFGLQPSHYGSIDMDAWGETCLYRKRTGKLSRVKLTDYTYDPLIQSGVGRRRINRGGTGR